LFGLLGGKSKQKKKLQGGKPKMTYITGGKDLLTQKIICISVTKKKRKTDIKYYSKR